MNQDYTVYLKLELPSEWFNYIVKWNKRSFHFAYNAEEQRFAQSSDFQRALKRPEMRDPMELVASDAQWRYNRG